MTVGAELGFAVVGISVGAGMGLAVGLPSCGVGGGVGCGVVGLGVGSELVVGFRVGGGVAVVGDAVEGFGDGFGDGFEDGAFDGGALGAPKNRYRSKHAFPRTRFWHSSGSARAYSRGATSARSSARSSG